MVKADLLIQGPALQMARESPGAESPAPTFCMLDLLASDRAIEYAFMYNGSRFYIFISAEKLLGGGHLLEDFQTFLSDLDDPDIMFQFEEWILSPLHDFMRQVAPKQGGGKGGGTRKPITLLDYFSPPTYAFILVNKAGRLFAVQEEYNARVHGDSSPRTRIFDSLLDSGPSAHEPAGDTNIRGYNMPNQHFICRSSLPPVPHILASELERVDDELSDEEMSDVPRKVRRVGTDDVFFFKAGLKDHGLSREIELLSQINRSGNFSSPFRTSTLVGLVVWDDDKTSLMGFLLEYIKGETLASRMDSASIETKKRWLSQIESTLKRLHEVDIIWGDVKADNVMVNTDGDAVLIDFGGGYIPEYVTQELQQTAQGDLIGLDHIKAALGLTDGS
ncbi:kinase [Hirsutella rhossiliensis]|uniref:Kinase n=1 Tax=Hirsutella rhossiliensis TaxID=111463 RepID=A0A9P8SFL2_9HYPO|nr:kinase [Hirsutella rhossiliensis]KAH0961053.1 kinase [Hirsutella rhossiliensis]